MKIVLSFPILENMHIYFFLFNRIIHVHIYIYMCVDMWKYIFKFNDMKLLIVCHTGTKKLQFI